MALLLQTHYTLSIPSQRYSYLFSIPNPNSNPSLLILAKHPKSQLHFSNHRSLTHRSPPSSVSASRREPSQTTPLKLPNALVSVAVSAALFLCCGIRACSASLPPLTTVVQQEQQTIQDDNDARKLDDNENIDKELEASFNAWKSKTYALTVPLKVVALRGSIPPSWIKDFINSQGKRMMFEVKYHESLESIFSDLSIPFTKENHGPTSTLAADIVGIGDSWLKFAIQKAIIEPIQDVEDKEWFKSLAEKWKVYLRRNSEGEMDPEGDIWAAPYRWGSMVIAYKTNNFQKHKLAPIEDWADLWRPDLAGRISMVNSPRDVVGAVLKYMGASYNANDINLEVNGGRDAVKHNLALLAKQLLFQSPEQVYGQIFGQFLLHLGFKRVSLVDALGDHPH
ncbi:unnamed protein product [Trifolium pratense]|uniref:Uncharacterized protein n=1 Tax=Trifolium pratense TaxID=57577 RepID=A0ACB0IVU8_TRIPR|nr:unnamed protein product [Trifolium pratense]